MCPIHDTKHLFLTDPVNATAHLQMYGTELLYKYVKIVRRREMRKIKFTVS